MGGEEEEEEEEQEERPVHVQRILILATRTVSCFEACHLSEPPQIHDITYTIFNLMNLKYMRLYISSYRIHESPAVARSRPPGGEGGGLEGGGGREEGRGCGVIETAFAKVHTNKPTRYARHGTVILHTFLLPPPPDTVG